jgi:hypothetical protein
VTGLPTAKDGTDAVSYRVALPKGSRIHDVISIIHLRKFRGDGSDIRPLPISEEDEEKVYEVEKIVGKWIRKIKAEFLVKWKGYPDDEMTWEPEKHPEGAKEALMDWRATQGQEQKREKEPQPAEKLTPATSDASAFPATDDIPAVTPQAEPPVYQNPRAAVPIPPLRRSTRFNRIAIDLSSLPTDIPI